MNDVSLDVMDVVEPALSKRFPGILVTTAKVSEKNKRFPVFYAVFSFPEPTPDTRDSSGTEKWTRTRLVGTAYSRTSLAEAASIINVADEVLGGLGFSRSNWTEVPDADSSIRRIQATWLASASANGEVAAW